MSIAQNTLKLLLQITAQLIKILQPLSTMAHKTYNLKANQQYVQEHPDK
jgi:hypothetical protein